MGLPATGIRFETKLIPFAWVVPVQEAGKTVVIVLHDNFASCYSHRIVALKDGVVVGEGPVAIYDLDIQVSQVGAHRVCAYYV